MNPILFLATVAISFLVVRVGAVALHMTGLEWPLAKFQSLSCFSGTGFTTKEAELITGHPRRRHIASILMVLGNAGLVTLIATFANSIKARPIARPAASNIFWPPHPLVNLLIIVIALYAAYRVFTRTSAAQRLTDYVRSKLRKRGIVESVSFEELLVSTGGYGIARTEIRDNSPLAEETLEASGLREKDITVLVVKRTDEAIPNPSAKTRLQKGDILLCFGRLDHMKKEFRITA